MGGIWEELKEKKNMIIIYSTEKGFFLKLSYKKRNSKIQPMMRRWKAINQKDPLILHLEDT